MMETDTIRGHKSSIDNHIDSNMEMQSLRDELDRLNLEFLRANEERAKAAEYGLVLLEEKQQLQYKAEELASLYETSKQELEASTDTLRQVSRDYEKRIKDMERQREQLIVEMEEREKELLGKVEGLEEERRGLERQLKKTSSQNDYLAEANAIMSSENERLKKDLEEQKQDMQLVKKELQAVKTELDYTKTELDKARLKLEKFAQIEQELQSMTEENTTLNSELITLQDQYDRILNERDDLEQQTKEVYEALNEEREAKNVLESRLHEDILRSPDRMHWLTESIPHLNEDIRLSSAPNSPLPITHSSPFSATPSLLSELQHSYIPVVSASEMHLPSAGGQGSQHMMFKLKEMEHKNGALELEREELMKQLEGVCGDLEKLKSKHQEVINSNEIDVRSLKDELTTKKEIISQLKGKLSSLSGEKATLEIELEGVKDEMNRLRDAGKMDSDKFIKEIADEQMKSKELQGRIAELEEKLSQSVSRTEKLENILVNSTNEVTSMKEEVLNLHKAVISLHSENKFSSPPISSLVDNNSTLPSNEGPSDYYYLSVQEGKRKLSINKEAQTISEVVQVRELLRNVRIPMEVFTKKMLELSLETSSHHMTGNPMEKTDDNLKKITELEGTISKMRARLANKTEEVNQLRTIMKARQTTVDVTVSSLKSKLEGQNRSHESDLTQMKNKIKNLRKERDDQTSLCALTSKRCQEYLGEIAKLKRKIEEVKGESDQLRSENRLVNVYLERAIKQKLDISQQLDKYREEEERTKVIPLTISASRV